MGAGWGQAGGAARGALLGSPSCVCPLLRGKKLCHCPVPPRWWLCPPPPHPQAAPCPGVPAGGLTAQVPLPVGSPHAGLPHNVGKKQGRPQNLCVPQRGPLNSPHGDWDIWGRTAAPQLLGPVARAAPSGVGHGCHPTAPARPAPPRAPTGRVLWGASLLTPQIPSGSDPDPFPGRGVGCRARRGCAGLGSRAPSPAVPPPA